MRKIIEYRLIKCYSDRLAINVQDAIEKGWQPLGSASSVILTNGKMKTTQAMVKYKKGKDE